MTDNTEKLQKVLAHFGVCSRRAAEQLIAEGRVSVNGGKVEQQGMRVNVAEDIICVDGERLLSKPQFIYILLHKPTGYICSVNDERGRRTVLELMPEISERLYPVGRLDYATSGALLLTNDGELTNLLLHPKGEIEKTYLAFVEGRVPAAAIRRLESGVRLSDGITAPAKVCINDFKDGQTLLEITIHEGKNRQVRRMLEAVGCPCLRLKRLTFAGLTVDYMKIGAWRELTAEEIFRLRALAYGEKQ